MRWTPSLEFAEQRLVSQAEKLREQGLSWQEIARRWNAEGIPTPTGKGKWHDVNILRLVKNTERPADHLSHASPIMTPEPSLMRVRMQRAKKSQTLTVTDVSDSAL